MQAYNKLVFDCEKVLDDCRLMQQTLTDCTEIDEKLAEVYHELEITAELTRKCITENSQNVMNQDEYLKKYNGYVERYEKQKTQADELEKRKQARIDKSISIGGFMFELSEYNEGITEFDDMLWTMTVDKAVVHNDGRIVFVFRNGMEIEG